MEQQNHQELDRKIAETELKRMERRTRIKRTVLYFVMMKVLLLCPHAMQEKECMLYSDNVFKLTYEN